jgi:hypothetical protein
MNVCASSRDDSCLLGHVTARAEVQRTLSLLFVMQTATFQLKPVLATEESML